MSTKSTRSSGTQFNARGVTQGNTLVGQKSGLPIDEVVDINGVRRLAVDAALTLDSVTIDTRELKPDTDQVGIGDPQSGNTLEIEADGSINVNVELDAADGDNIAIHDSGGNELNINPDGSINVNITTSNPGVVRSIYNEVTSVSTATLTTVATYTAPIGVKSFLQKIEVSGTNIAEYRILINATIVDKKRSYFGGSLDSEFIFALTGTGLDLAVGDVVTVKVIHSRPTVGDFNARIQVIEV